MIAELERRTREEFEDDPDATHLDYVVGWVESGGTIVGLLEEMGDGMYRRAMLMKYLEAQYGAEVTRRMNDARVEGAHAMVEDAAEIVDNARADKDSIALAKLRSDSKNFLASRWNRAAYGEPKAGIALQVNLGSAFLDSLRRANQAQLDSRRSPAFRSDSGAEESAHLTKSGEQAAIAGAIASEAQDVTFEVLSD